MIYTIYLFKVYFSMFFSLSDNCIKNTDKNLVHLKGEGEIKKKDKLQIQSGP